MKTELIKNSLSGLRFQRWTLLETLAYFFVGISRELNIFPVFFQKIHKKTIIARRYKRLQICRKECSKSNQDTTYFDALEYSLKYKKFKTDWLKYNNGKSYLDIKGAKLPVVELENIFGDTFLISAFFNDDYNKSLVDILDQYMDEGPYGYIDGSFDVTVKAGDVVIDAGAWVGDFSAYAVSKGATAYAFEPVKESFDLLCKTATLNDMRIYPIQKGLANKECEIGISLNGVGSSFVTKIKNSESEKITLTTLDKFVQENKLDRVDFIKADIEGAERDMLRGATNVLKTFAPKLAICTYHLPDDPEVLEKIILEANPDYTVVHLRHKLMAAVVNK